MDVSPTRVSADELSTQLGVDRARIEQLVVEGLPWRSGGRRKRFKWDVCWFDEDEAAEWLIERGYLSEPKLVTRLADVAQHFGVSTRSVMYWRDQGAPISDDGYYDLDLIAAWREARHGNDDGEQGESRAEFETDLSRIKAEKAQLELDEQRGRLVDVEICERVFGRHMAELKAQLESAAEWQLTLLPANTPAGVLKRVKSETIRRSHDILTRQAEMMQELSDEIKAERTSIKRKRSASRTLRGNG